MENKNRKEDEACGKENENKGEQRNGENNYEKIKEVFWNWLWKQSKKKGEYYERNLMVSNY